MYGEKLTPLPMLAGGAVCFTVRVSTTDTTATATIAAARRGSGRLLR